MNMQKSDIFLNQDDMDGYDIIKQISHGPSTDVYKVCDKRTNQYYVFKIFNSDRDDDETIKNFKDLRLFMREMELLSHINSPYLIQTIGICLNYEFRGYQRPAIVLEYAPNGSLQEIIQSYEHYPNENWTDTKKLICIYGIAAGMEYLHSENIIHRNLKPENILLDKFLHPKITGFGLSRISNIDMEKSMSKGVGTFQFMAPEIMNEDEYSSKVDVFSFGMIVHLILTGKMPFSGPFFHFIRTGNLDISKKIPGVYRELISRCLSFDPKDRPTFSEIVSFLKSDKNFITEKVDKKEFLTYLGLIENDDKSEFDQVEIKFNKKVGKLTISAKQIDLSQFEKLEKIGSGGFAKVFKVADVKTGMFYAAKISILELELCDDKIITNLVQEINILSKLRTLTKLNTHSILSFIGFSQNNFKNQSRNNIRTIDKTKR